MGLWNDITGAKGYHLYTEHAGSVLGLPIPASGVLGDLFALDTDFILELYTSDYEGGYEFTSAVSFPLAPESMQISRDPATQITPTLGVLPVREHSVNRFLSIRMRGRSGVAKRQGHDRDGAIITADGQKILQEFDAFLDVYQQLATAHLVLSPNDIKSVPYLVFRSFSNGIHARVEPQNWTLTKDTKQSRFGYTWFLDLRAYAPAEPESAPQLFGVAQAVAAFGAETVLAAASVVSLATTAVDRTTELANSGRAAIQAAAALAGGFGDLLDATDDFKSIPDGYVSDLANVAVTAQIAISRWAEGQTASAYENANGADLLASVEALAIAATTFAGATGQKAAFSLPVDLTMEAATTGAVGLSDLPTHVALSKPGASTQSAERKSKPVGIVVGVPAYGGIESLAKRYYGNRASWPKIADANNMSSAYIMADGSPITPGAQLFVPLDSARLELARTAPTQDLVTDTMATDLWLDPKTGDLQILADDLRRVRGTENMEQAIRLRLFSVQGESSPFPAYGLPAVIGTGVTARTAGWIASHLHNQLTRDPRITEILSASILDEGDSVSASLEVRPITGSSFAVIAPLG